MRRLRRGFGWTILAAIVIPTALLGLWPGGPPSQWISMQIGVAQGLAFVPVGADGPRSRPDAGGGARLSVVTFNAQGEFSAADLAALTSQFDPDIIVIPEGGAPVDAAVRGTDFAHGIHHAGLDWVRGIEPTTVLVHRRVGAVAASDGPPTTFGTVAVTLSRRVEVVGLHTFPPLSAGMERWRADLDSAHALDRAPGTRIVAGDFNATLRHGPLANRRGLVDAAQSCGRVDGTWPVRKIGGFLRSPIDHIFVSDDIRVVSCATAEIGTTDHLALAAVLELPR